MGRGSGSEDGWREQREALRRWADRGRAAWLLGEGASVALGMLAEDATGPDTLVTRLEAVIARAGFGEGSVTETPRPGAPAVVQLRSRAAGQSHGQATAVWRDGERALCDLALMTLFVGAAMVRGAWATAVVGVVADGTKHVLGLWRGCTADAVVAREVVDGLAGRGLDRSRGLLVVHDGSQALDAAVRRVWGGGVLLGHCQHCVCGEVLGHLPEKERPGLRQALRGACAATGQERARRLATVAEGLAGQHPGAAQRLRRSLEALCSVDRLGVPAPLRDHLRGIGPVRQLAEAANRAKVAATGPSAIAAVLPRVLPGMRRIIGYEALPLLAERLAAQAAASR